MFVLSQVQSCLIFQLLSPFTTTNDSLTTNICLANCNLCVYWSWLVTTYLLIVLRWFIRYYDMLCPLTTNHQASHHKQLSTHHSNLHQSWIMTVHAIIIPHSFLADGCHTKLNIFHRKHLSPLLQKSSHKQTLQSIKRGMGRS